MQFSSSAKFLHVPISISPTISNNFKIYNSVSPYTTSYLPPPRPAAAKRRGGYLCVKCNGGTGSSMPQLGKDDDDDNDSNKAPKRFHKLYEAMKNKNMTQLSEVLADECPPSAYNSIPFLRIIRAKLQMFEFLSHLFKGLGNGLKFTVMPTTKDGTMVGIKWKIGWEKTLMTLGQGVDIHSHHSYAGKLLFGNLETMMDHFLQPKPMRLMDLDLMGKAKAKQRRRDASLNVGLFLLALSVFFFQFCVG